MLISVLLLSLFLYQVQSQDNCKNPYVEKRLLADDVRYASPFYVIALPRTPQTVEMDNVCYTYFENGDGGFFHVMSITYKNGTNIYHDFRKGDISNRMGIAEAKSNDCVYHDYTLKPICNQTVFILYRCYIEGKCSSIDVAPMPGVDVRVTLAAAPQVSPACRAETESSLRDTSALAGGDYIILPQKLTPNCITKYDSLVSIGDARALGPKAVSNSLSDRFANEPLTSAAKPVAPPTTQNKNNFFQKGVPPPSAFNPYGHNSGSNAPYPASGQSYPSGNNYGYATKNPTRYSPTQTSTAPVRNNVPGSPPQWNGQSIQPGAETHYHIWQSAASASVLKSISTNNPNVYYHIHSWGQPQNCCQCL